MTTDKHERKNKSLWLFISIPFCTLLLIIIPPFYRSNPITYTDVNIVLALFLLMSLNLCGAVLSDEASKEVKRQLEELNRRLDELTAKKEDIT